MGYVSASIFSTNLNVFPGRPSLEKLQHPGSYHHCTMPVVPQQNAPADLRRSRGHIVSDRIRNEQKSHLLAAQYERITLSFLVSIHWLAARPKQL